MHIIKFKTLRSQGANETLLDEQKSINGKWKSKKDHKHYFHRVHCKSEFIYYPPPCSIYTTSISYQILWIFKKSVTVGSPKPNHRSALGRRNSEIWQPWENLGLQPFGSWWQLFQFVLILTKSGQGLTVSGIWLIWFWLNTMVWKQVIVW